MIQSVATDEHGATVCIGWRRVPTMLRPCTKTSSAAPSIPIRFRPAGVAPPTAQRRLWCCGATLQTVNWWKKCTPLFTTAASPTRADHDHRCLTRPDDRRDRHLDGRRKVRARHIRGVVINGATGQPSPATMIAIPKKASPNMVVLTGNADSNGVFDLAGAMPGTLYSVFATTTSGNTAGIPASTIAAAAAAGVTLAGAGTTLLGYVPVEVPNMDVEGVKILSVPGINLTGRVVIEGRSQPGNDADLARECG